MKFLVIGSLVAAAGCAQPSVAPQERPQSSVLSQGPLSSQHGEKADYHVDGDVVAVNNHICAMSGAPLQADKLGQFQSRVVYDGPDPKFRGKTLVFNQCCPMCVQTFHDKWAKERDSIMRFHGLQGS